MNKVSRSELKSFFKEKGFNISIRTASPKHYNAGFFLVEILDTDLQKEKEFDKTIKKICPTAQSTSMFGWSLDPIEIDLRKEEQNAND